MRWLFRPWVMGSVGILLCGAVFAWASIRWASWDIVASPFSYIYQRLAGVSRIVDRVVHVAELARQNAHWESEYHSMLARLSQADALADENEQLRQALRLPALASRRVVDAGIAGMSADPLDLRLVLNHGNDRGIEIGDIVIAPEGFLIGIVDAVNERSSTVRALIDREIKITIRTIDTNVTGIAQGVLSDGLYVQFVSQQDRMEVGDLVVTSGSDRFFAGIPIGKVYRTHIPTGALFQDVYVRSFLEEQRPYRVLVVRP